MPNFFGLSIEHILQIILFLVPGFVSIQVYRLMFPSQNKELHNYIPDLLSYSLFNLLLWFWLINPKDSISILQWTGWEKTVFGLLILFISPAVLGFFWIWIRTQYLPNFLGMDNPIPKGWDYFVRTNKEYFILFHLKNGKKMGGYFGENSYASTFPVEPEFFVEQVWRVDESGVFIEPVIGSAGAVVRQAEWDLIEFLKVERETTNG